MTKKEAIKLIIEIALAMASFAGAGTSYYYYNEVREIHCQFVIGHPQSGPISIDGTINYNCK